MNTKNTIQKATDLIKTSIKMKVMGAEDIEIFEEEKATGNFYTRLQTLVIDEENGTEKVINLKLDKQVSFEKYNNKNIEAINAQEIKIGFDTYYKASGINEIDEKLDSNFVVNKSISLTITNVSIIKPKDTKKPTNYALFSSFKIGNKLESFKIKVKEVGDEKAFLALKNKKVNISNLNVMKIEMKTFYSIESMTNLV